MGTQSIDNNRHTRETKGKSGLAYLSSHSLDLQVAAEAAGEAGKVIVEAYGKAIGLDMKGVGDIVTEVDREADRAIHTYLKVMCPIDQIVSEELSPNPARSAGRTWYVDPLDGASAFVFRTDPRHPSVMLALADEHGLAVSVVHFPLTSEWFYAERGVGAFRNGSRIAPNHLAPALGESRVMLNHYGDAAYETMLFASLRDTLRGPGGAALVTVEPPHSGTACRVIEPGSQVYVAIHDNNRQKLKQAAWDIAAPRLIVEQAGGAFVDCTGKPYPLDGYGPIIIARTLSCAEALIRMTRLV